MSSSGPAALLLLLVPQAAWAGACCVGGASAVPVRVGDAEHALVGVTAGAEVTHVRWDRDGAVRSPGMRDQSAVGSLGAGVALNGQLQVAATLPVRLTHRAAGSVDGWGGGVGDLRATVLWEPVEAAGSGPVPTFRLGVRVPTGRDWTESQGVMLEDVTGLDGPGVIGGAQLERLTGDVPWLVGVTSEVGFTGVGPQPVITGLAAVGRSLSTNWTLLGLARYTASWADTADGRMAARPGVGARLVHGRPREFRVWGDVAADLPLPGVGRAGFGLVSASVGAALVR